MITTANQQTRKENEKISKIIDRVMRQVFGDEATRLIYRYLENNYSVRRDEIADKIDLFAKGLEDFLRSGAYAIERKILEDIYSSYGLLRRIELERLREGDFASQVKLLMRKT
jgi:5'-deoxynucleotidase YfbR-like HD superfamily hydrolase